MGIVLWLIAAVLVIVGIVQLLAPSPAPKVTVTGRGSSSRRRSS